MTWMVSEYISGSNQYQMSILSTFWVTIKYAPPLIERSNSHLLNLFGFREKTYKVYQYISKLNLKFCFELQKHSIYCVQISDAIITWKLEQIVCYSSCPKIWALLESELSFNLFSQLSGRANDQPVRPFIGHER